MTNFKHPASMRDPAGYLVKCDNRLIRVIRPEFVCDYKTMLTGSWLQEQIHKGSVTAFRILDTDEAVSLVGLEAVNCLCLEHDIISFPSYPSEWSLEMLCASAEHTLILCQQALQHGLGLKDATPFNVLFRGSSPVFVDILSFEKRTEGDPTWLAYGQFVRSFLLPALLDGRYCMSCHNTFIARRDGIEPEEVYRLLSPLARLAPSFFGCVTMPVLLSSRAERQSSNVYAQKILSNPDHAAFILKSLFSRLIRSIHSSTTRRKPANTWSTYTKSCTYTLADTGQKAAFVEHFMKSFRPKRVLDVGCNTGAYSFLAAQYGAEVVATDLDPEVVGSLWQRAKEENANILPLVVNLSRPTPALGWRNRETLSFLERAEGYFDAVLMLAVVHHLLVADQIPLDEIVEQASRLTTKWLVIEYVGLDDQQFKRLLRGRADLYTWYDQTSFEIALKQRFTIIERLEISDNGRWLYLLRLNTHE